LLASQIQTLERPQADETDVVTLDIRAEPVQLVAMAILSLTLPAVSA
jgi:gluconate kinase